jgi:hypothetical protein
MAWQQTGALLVVAATIAAFAWSQLRKRKRGTIEKYCDCAGNSSVATPPSTVLRGRKWERPQLVVKLK